MILIPLLIMIGIPKVLPFMNHIHMYLFDSLTIHRNNSHLLSLILYQENKIVLVLLLQEVVILVVIPCRLE